MRISQSVLLKIFLPLAVMGVMVLTPLHAEEKTTDEIEKSDSKKQPANDVPPPAGPYRSMHGVDQSVRTQNNYQPPKWVQEQQAQMNQGQSRQGHQGRAMPPQQNRMQDTRQWTPPTPPQWVQQQRQQQNQRPDWSKQQPVPAWVQEQRKQMAKPHQPPKWVQQQRQQQAQRPDWSKQQQVPAWVQEQRKQMAQPYQPPKWVEQQRQQQAQRPDWSKQQKAPAWLEEQRKQMTKQQQEMITHQKEMMKHQQEMAKQQKEMGACLQAPQQAQQNVSRNQNRAPPQYWAQNRMQRPSVNGQYRRFGPPPTWTRGPYPQFRRW